MQQGEPRLVTLGPGALSANIPLGAGGLWEWIAAITRGERVALLIEPLALDELSNLPPTFRLIAGTLALVVSSRRQFGNELELARMISDPLVAAASAGSARSCDSCGGIFDVRVAPGLERPELGGGLCPGCSRKYDPQAARARADRLLIPLAQAGPYRIPPPPGYPGTPTGNGQGAAEALF